MTELYVFRGTAGKAEMITDDKSGKKLPPHSFGEWVFSRTIVVASETRLIGGVDCRQVLANVATDGYHHWPWSLISPATKRPRHRQRFELIGAEISRVGKSDEPVAFHHSTRNRRGSDAPCSWRELWSGRTAGARRDHVHDVAPLLKERPAIAAELGQFLARL
jgi:hypothetical protein